MELLTQGIEHLIYHLHNWEGPAPASPVGPGKFHEEVILVSGRSGPGYVEPEFRHTMRLAQAKWMSRDWTP